MTKHKMKKKELEFILVYEYTFDRLQNMKDYKKIIS